MKKKYEIIYENEKGALLRTTKFDKGCKDICFVHQRSYEKLYKTRYLYNYGLRIYPQYIYLYKMSSNSSIEEQGNNLIEALIYNKIREVNLIAVSYGALISAICSKKELVNNIAVFQAPFWGTPLADIDNWNNFNSVVSGYLKKRYQKSQFLDDLKNGLSDKWHLVNSNKIIFVYGYSTRVKGLLSFHNRRYFWPEIKRITHMDNDAVVPFPKLEIINNMNFKKVVYLNNLYHICTIFKKYHKLLIKEVNNG